MNDIDLPSPKASEPNPEPGSSPAPAAPRGPTLWSRLKSLLALRTVSLRDDLEVALGDETSPEAADFTQSERTILQNVLKLGEMRVDDVMVPRVDIEAVDAEETLAALLARFRAAGHSRLPVYDDNLDNVLGFVHVKDAMRRVTTVVEPGETGKDLPIKLVSTALRHKIGKLDLMRTALFVPPSMPVGDLLTQMQTKRVHMAIVVDEYGGTDGLVTIEDLLEAVVGDIEDEHDDLDSSLVRKVNSNTFIASSRAELAELRAVLGAEFDPGDHEEAVDTLGGLIFALVGHVPVAGDVVKGLKGFEFEVLQADQRQVRKVKIKRIVKRTPRPKPPRPAAANDQNQAAAE